VQILSFWCSFPKFRSAEEDDNMYVGEQFPKHIPLTWSGATYPAPRRSLELALKRYKLQLECAGSQEPSISFPLSLSGRARRSLSLSLSLSLSGMGVVALFFVAEDRSTVSERSSWA